MKLYIEIVDGKPINHPYTELSLRTQYPEHDWSTGAPSKYASFKRVRRPEHGIYENIDEEKGAEYKLVDGQWQDVWTIIPFTADEKTQAQKDVKDWFKENSSDWSWTYNEEKNQYEPPHEPPNDGNGYIWNEAAYQADNTKGWDQHNWHHWD